MARSVAPFALAALVACGASEASKHVRLFTSKESVAACEDMGQITGHASGWGDKFRKDAEDAAREEAADRGADAIVVTGHEAGFSGHEIRANAYRCTAAPPAAVAAAAAPAAAPARPLPRLAAPTSLLVLDLRMLAGDANVGHIVTSVLTTELTKVGNLTVIGHGDIEAAIDLEKRRDLLDCDTTSCLVEISGAMGASLVLHGDIGGIGDQYVVTANLFDSVQQRSRARVSRTVARDDGALLRIIPDLTAELAEQMVRSAP